MKRLFMLMFINLLLMAYSAYTQNVYLIKTDGAGNEEWSKTLGGDYPDIGYSVQNKDDGGFIIVGDTNSFGTSMDVYLIKTDSAGNELWHKTLGDDNTQYGFSVKQTKDGGFIIVGKNNFYIDVEG
jgi:hypothetical protein